MIEKLNELKSLKFNSSDELRKYLQDYPAFRSTLEQLSKRFLGRAVSGCSNCYFDAFMELKFKKIEKMSRFELLRGALLYDPVNGDISRIMTAANCTDELALYHLKHNPNCRKYFSVLPDDLDELLENDLPDADDAADADTDDNSDPQNDSPAVKRVRKPKVPAE